MRLSNSNLWQKRREIMFGVLLIALAASLIATIIIAEEYGSVTLLTSPDGQSIESPGGEPLNISCEGFGGKAGKFSFFKWTMNEGEEIMNGDPSSVKIGNKLLLIFKNPDTNNSGIYSCSAVYDNGIQLTKTVLVVFYVTGMKPEFHISYENVTLKAGKEKYLICEAEGEKPIEYKWYNQDEDRITDDEEKPVYVSSLDSQSRLNFKILGPEHEGSYTCTARNTHGLSSKVYHLTVSPINEDNDTDIDKGNKTTGFRDAKAIDYTTRSVTFHITTSGPIKYIDAKYTEGKRASNTTTIRLDPAQGNIYEIGNLIPSGYYSFQFRTVPSESDEWSREYNVTLLPDAPELIWQSIGEKSVKLQWFRKTDDSLRGTIDRHQIKYSLVQMNGGNSWRSWNCSVTIELPSCYGSSYTMSGLGLRVFYEIEVRAHTAAGYSEPTKQKIYMQ